jgi:molecular chaperone DnaK (HSP70)
MNLWKIIKFKDSPVGRSIIRNRELKITLTQEKNGKIIGIDLGTTNLVLPSKKAATSLLEPMQRKSTTSFCRSFYEDGQRLVGQLAKRTAS